MARTYDAQTGTFYEYGGPIPTWEQLNTAPVVDDTPGEAPIMDLSVIAHRSPWYWAGWALAALAAYFLLFPDKSGRRKS